MATVVKENTADLHQIFSPTVTARSPQQEFVAILHNAQKEFFEPNKKEIATLAGQLKTLAKISISFATFSRFSLANEQKLASLLNIDLPLTLHAGLLNNLGLPQPKIVSTQDLNNTLQQLTKSDLLPTRIEATGFSKRLVSASNKLQQVAEEYVTSFSNDAFKLLNEWKSAVSQVIKCNPDLNTPELATLVKFISTFTTSSKELRDLIPEGQNRAHQCAGILVLLHEHAKQIQANNVMLLQELADKHLIVTDRSSKITELSCNLAHLTLPISTNSDDPVRVAILELCCATAFELPLEKYQVALNKFEDAVIVTTLQELQKFEILKSDDRKLENLLHNFRLCLSQLLKQRSLEHTLADSTANMPAVEQDSSSKESKVVIASKEEPVVTTSPSNPQSTKIEESISLPQANPKLDINTKSSKNEPSTLTTFTKGGSSVTHIKPPVERQIPSKEEKKAPAKPPALDKARLLDYLGNSKAANKLLGKLTQAHFDKVVADWNNATQSADITQRILTANPQIFTFSNGDYSSHLELIRSTRELWQAELPKLDLPKKLSTLSSAQVLIAGLQHIQGLEKQLQNYCYNFFSATKLSPQAVMLIILIGLRDQHGFRSGTKVFPETGVLKLCHRRLRNDRQSKEILRKVVSYLVDVSIVNRDKDALAINSSLTTSTDKRSAEFVQFLMKQENREFLLNHRYLKSHALNDFENEQLLQFSSLNNKDNPDLYEQVLPTPASSATETAWSAEEIAILETLEREDAARNSTSNASADNIQVPAQIKTLTVTQAKNHLKLCDLACRSIEKNLNSNQDDSTEKIGRAIEALGKFMVHAQGATRLFPEQMAGELTNRFNKILILAITYRNQFDEQFLVSLDNTLRMAAERQPGVIEAFCGRLLDADSLSRMIAFNTIIEALPMFDEAIATSERAELVTEALSTYLGSRLKAATNESIKVPDELEEEDKFMSNVSDLVKQLKISKHFMLEAFEKLYSRRELFGTYIYGRVVNDLS